MIHFRSWQLWTMFSWSILIGYIVEDSKALLLGVTRATTSHTHRHTSPWMFYFPIVISKLLVSFLTCCFILRFCAFYFLMNCRRCFPKNQKKKCHIIWLYILICCAFNIINFLILPKLLKQLYKWENFTLLVTFKTHLYLQTLWFQITICIPVIILQKKKKKYIENALRF